MRRVPRWSLVLLAAVTVAGGVLRFDAAATPSRYQSFDEQSYARIANALVAFHTYGHYGPEGQKDPMHWPPGAPLMFALAHRLDPHPHRHADDGDWDIPGAYNWQAGVGTLTIVATFALATLVAGHVAGLVAATAIAFYPPLIDASGDLLSEPLGALLLTSAMAATVLVLRRRTWPAGVLAGALLAGTILTRADLILVPLIAIGAVAIVAWREAGGVRRGAAAARAAGPMLATFLVILTPWTIFASSVADTFVPVSTGGASNLWVGTYLPGDGSIFGSKRALADEAKALFPHLRGRRHHQIAQTYIIRAVAARRPELDQEAALRAEALANLREYALGQPVQFAGMMAAKVWRLWGNYTRGMYTATQSSTRAYHLFLVGFGFLGLLAGLVFARQRAALWLLAAVPLHVTALNAVLVSEARHNLTSMPMLVAAGAAGFALALARLRADGSLRLPARQRDVVHS